MLEETKRTDDTTNTDDTEIKVEEETDDIEPLQPITEYKANLLKQEALTYKKMWEDFQVSFPTETNEDTYYLLSKRWLNRWKKYVSYEQITQDKRPTKYFGGPMPKKVNEDIIDKGVELCFQYIPLKLHPWNCYTKEGLQEGKDYDIVNKKISDYFINIYEGRPIGRYIAGNGSERYVEVNLARFQATLIYPNIVSGVCNGYSSKNSFDKEYLQCGRTMKYDDYLSLIEKTLPTFRGSFLRENGVRIWKSSASGDPFKALHNSIKKQTIDLEYHEDMVFDFDGELLDSSKYPTMEDVGLTSSDLLVIEFKESSKPWSIKNNAVAAEGKCEGCYKVTVLTNPCVCRKVSYCSEKCKITDEKYHVPKCEKAASDDETMKQIELTDQSVKGVCGLSNLGNTCFMNSGLQCLSNTKPLCQYFLSNDYFKDINEDNPLGSKGELVRKFGSLMKKVWCGNKSSVTPSTLKMAIGKFQPMFKGYQQHDSSELVTFLLDGIHEDLNRVKQKPYVESVDSNDRPDFPIAKESWEAFTKRNQSIVVDSMYGQYKSKLRCPTCGMISITFDPFLMVSLTVPNTKKKFLNYSVYTNLITNTKKSVPFEKASTQTALEFRTKVSETEFGGKEVLMMFTCNYQTWEVVKDTKIMTDVRKKGKKQGLSIRVLDQKEIEIPAENRVFLPIVNKVVEGYGYKRSMYQNFLIVQSKEWTLKQVHVSIMKLIGFLFKHLLKEGEELNEEFYIDKVQEKFYTLELKSNSSFWQNCAYCGKKGCSDCQLPFTDDKFEDFLSKATKSDQFNFSIEVSIVWSATPYEKTRLSDIYDHYVKICLIKDEDEEEKASSGSQSSSSPNIPTTSALSVNLYDCLTYSQQPEQLGAENTWYCRSCKDHVQAYKSMQIYKAPKILIFSLKRFKASNRMFKQKLETLVDFPLNGLDLGEFIINKNLPSQYNDETDQVNGEVKKDTKLIYDLYAVSNHFGGLGGGHYTAYAKNFLDNQWYNFDDSHASQVQNTDSIISKAAYILFYKIREEEDNKHFNHIEV